MKAKPVFSIILQNIQACLSQNRFNLVDVGQSDESVGMSAAEIHEFAPHGQEQRKRHA